MKNLTCFLPRLILFALLAVPKSGDCNPLKPAGPPVSDAFNVRNFGALGDGSNLDSPAIDRAITACAQAGGGTVFIPAGTYLCGSVHLTNHINLCLGTGAKILGAPQEMHAYDPAEPIPVPAYQDGGHSYFHNSLIWGENLVDVSITGHGMIDGGGLLRQVALLDRICGYEHFDKTNAAPVADQPTQDELRAGNKSICLKCCRRVLLRDITIFHGGHFAILTTGCDDLTIDNLTIDTDRDGVDLDCCQNVTVTNCRVNSPMDDGICPKSSYALGSNVITENLTIVNCQVSGFEEGTLLDGTMKPAKNGTGRIKFGTEASGGFRNCTVSNCTFLCCRGLALEEVDGGTLENITVNNLTMMNGLQYAIYITLGTRNRGPAVTVPGKLKNILISNVSATQVSGIAAIEITGSPGNDIENLRLENIRLQTQGGQTREIDARTFPELGRNYPEPSGKNPLPAYGIFVRHVRNVELSDINVRFESQDKRPALVAVDVEGLKINHLTAQTAGVDAAKFDGVKGLLIQNSPGINVPGDK